MGKPSERITIIEIDPMTGQVDRQRVLQVAMDFIGTLFAVGGKLQIAADRVVIDEVVVGESVQPIAETQGLVFRFQSFSPARRPEELAPLEAEDGGAEPDAAAADAADYAAEHDGFEDAGAVLEREIPVEDRDDLLSPEEIADLQAQEQALAANA